MICKSNTLADLHLFDSIIDVRSPSEYELDHIPNAINCPILNDSERHIIGFTYARLSSFSAKKLGGSIAARNISSFLQEFSEKPRSWFPLVYCSRGRLRSAVLVSWMQLIGWDARQLEGGYKSWRTYVQKKISEFCPKLNLQVLCGSTGCAKTYILKALESEGEQILDLENLAKHRGSVLGELPNGIDQPAQKKFETLLFQALENFNLNRRVWIEAESRRIGKLLVPNILLKQMRMSPLLEISANLEVRLACLLKDYSWYFKDPLILANRIQRLKGVQAECLVKRWEKLALEKKWRTLFKELIQNHYDPIYNFSRKRNFKNFSEQVILESFSARGIKTLAERIISMKNLKNTFGIFS